MALIHLIENVISTKLPLILPSLGVIFTIFLVQTILKGNPLSKIPVIGEELGSDEKRRQVFNAEGKSLYLEGYKKFKDSCFRIVATFKSPAIVIPAKHLNELRNLPDDVVSIAEAIEELLHAKYTKLMHDDLIARIVKSNLTPALPRINSELTEEVEVAFRTVVPLCDDWTPVHIYKTIAQVVARVSGRVFVGTQFSRSPEYLDTAINYTYELFRAREAVDKIRPWLRPFLAPRLPEVKALDARLATGMKLLGPLVDERRQLLNTDNEPDDMLQWVIKGLAKHRQDATKRVAQAQLGLAMAAIETTSSTATNVLYSLAAYPEYVPILRQEISDLLVANNGTLTHSALQNMKRLDSFIKETMRVHSLGSTSFNRKVLKTFALSTGEVIPAGVMIEIASYAISQDSANVSNPEEFQPWRFYELSEKARASNEPAAQHQFVSTGTPMLTFGWGRHACPGRFFAANEIKLILAHILLKYDIKLPDGVEGRYQNFEFAGRSTPDPTKTLLFKERAAAAR